MPRRGARAGYAEVRPRLGVESRALFDQLHLFRPSSKVVIRFLTVMMKHGYISEFEVCCNLMHDLSSKSLAFIRSSMIIALAKLWSTWREGWISAAWSRPGMCKTNIRQLDSCSPQVWHCNQRYWNVEQQPAALKEVWKGESTQSTYCWHLSSGVHPSGVNYPLLGGVDHSGGIMDHKEARRKHLGG